MTSGRGEHHFLWFGGGGGRLGMDPTAAHKHHETSAYVHYAGSEPPRGKELGGRASGDPIRARNPPPLFENSATVAVVLPVRFRELALGSACERACVIRNSGSKSQEAHAAQMQRLSQVRVDHADRRRMDGVSGISEALALFNKATGRCNYL